MNRKVWTDQELDILKEMYYDHFAEEIAAILGRGKPSIYCKARQLGLDCNPEKIRRAGSIGTKHPNAMAHRFSKGSTPANKGKRVSPEIYAKMQPTMFKKGQVSHNHREVGSERVNVDGYLEIKVAEPNKWRPKNRVIWEAAYGEIPQGCNIQFKDHNPLNCTLENLYIISREDQMAKENSFYAKYPKELQEVIHLKGVVNRAIHKAQRNGK